MQNANIIMSGVNAQPVNALAQGQAAGQAANDYRYQRDYQSTLRQHGAGAMNGNQASMNALAAFDPAVVQNLAGQRLGMDATRLGMDQTRQNMDAQRQQMRFLDQQQASAVAAAAAQMTAAQAADQAAKIRAAVASGMAAQTPQQWDALMAQSPETQQYVGRFGERDMIAGSFMEIADMLERSDSSAQGGERYRPVGGQIWDFAPEGGGAPSLVGGGQEEIIFGADGQPIVSRGPAGTGQRFTESQGKDNVFSTRARGALEVLEPVADALVSRGERIAGAVPLGVGREFQSDDFQVAENAGNEFLQAILRKDTGAAITEQEQVLYGRTYLPQPGDGPAVLEAKRQARIRAINAIEAGMSPSQMVAQERALQSSAAEAGVPAQPTEPRVNANGPVMDGPVTAQSIRQMTPMQMAEFMSTTTDLTTLPDDVLQAIIDRGE